MKIEEVLKKCFENKILVHFEHEKSYSEKFGIIERFDNKKIILKEIDKMTGIFVSKSEILIEDISFLQYLEKFFLNLYLLFLLNSFCH